MASSLIHMCVVKVINEKIKRDSAKLLIGSIAPDISKEVGLSRNISHFQDEEDGVPSLESFLEKYRNNLNDDFVLGYYIHLYTDYIWFKTFLPNFAYDNVIYKLDGTVEKMDSTKLSKYIYNDYTNLNIKLIDEYNMDLSIFFNEVPILNNIIKEIPMDKIDVIVNKAGIIIENAKESKSYLFDIKEINKFIVFSSKVILENLKELGIDFN